MVGAPGRRAWSLPCVSLCWGQTKIHESLFASELILQLVVRSCYGLDGCWTLPRRAQRRFAVALSWA